MEKTVGVSASANGTTCMAFPSPATLLENGRSCSPLSASGRSSTAPVSLASSPGVHVPLASTASSQPASSSLVVSRNRYGQVTVTSQPTNESEFQLYRVLQHANLLSYYDTFISQGGDDVQQLCEAGEEEFLEIMALVGMASKPLHVRRLQKALQEWVHCPSRFQMPLLSLPGSGFLPAGRAVLPHPPVVPVPLVLQPTPPPATVVITPVKPSIATASCGNGSSGGSGSGQAPSVVCTRLTTPPTQQPQPPPLSPSPSGTSRDAAPSPSHSQDSRDTWQPQDLQRAADTTADPPYPSSSSPLLMTPVLMDSQIQRLAESAQLLASTLPSYEPKSNTSRKKISKELEFVMSMTAEDPKRMDKLRRYAAIYGRFDCKRKAEKPLTLHEVSVNEAAAQICAHLPALLTRRDELFPLARQVVRHSGYQYSKGHSRSQGAQCYSPRDFRTMDDGAGGDAKRLRLNSVDSPDTYMPYKDEQWRRRQERLEQISEELRQLRSQAEELGLTSHKQEESRDPTGLPGLQSQLDAVQDQERQLLVEQNNLILLDRQFFKSCLEFDEEDSQMSLGSAPSPTGTGGCDSSRDEDTANESQDRPTYKLSKKLGACSPVEPGLRHARKSAVQQRCAPPSSGAAAGFPYPEQKVIASSAGNIIAVANPALSMSTVCEPMSLVNYKSESAYRIKSEPNSHNGAHNLTKD